MTNKHGQSNKCFVVEVMVEKEGAKGTPPPVIAQEWNGSVAEPGRQSEFQIILAQQAAYAENYKGDLGLTGFGQQGFSESDIWEDQDPTMHGLSNCLQGDIIHMGPGDEANGGKVYWDGGPTPNKEQPLGCELGNLEIQKGNRRSPQLTQ